MSRFTTRKIARAAALLGATLLASSQAAADDVVNDDQIVIGSECVGLSCGNGEVFNFDTLRLKGVANRIGLIDTTTDPEFPLRDWRIEANSNVQFGASYLALKDMGNTSDGSEGGTALLTLSAGAPANSIFVNFAGRVGFGTSTPARRLHVVTGNTPAIRLEQDGSGGFTPQTWEVVGNEFGFFVVDQTGSSLPFQILPNAGTNRLVLKNTGVGIGTESPGHALDVVGGLRARSAPDVFGLTLANASGTNMWIVRGSGAQGEGNAGQDLAFVARNDGGGLLGTRLFIKRSTGNVGIGTTAPTARLHTTGTVRFAGVANCASGIRSSAAGNLSCIPSTRRLKNIAGALSPDVALQNVMALRPQVGAYKDTPEEPEHWLIAEEVAEVDPALVGLKDGEPYTVKTYGVIADLVAVIQEQQREIEAQRAQFEARIAALEQALVRE